MGLVLGVGGHVRYDCFEEGGDVDVTPTAWRRSFVLWWAFVVRYWCSVWGFGGGHGCLLLSSVVVTPSFLWCLGKVLLRREIPRRVCTVNDDSAS